MQSQQEVVMITQTTMYLVTIRYNPIYSYVSTVDKSAI